MSDEAASSVPVDMSEKKRKSVKELLDQPFTEVTEEDVQLSVRDLINFLVFLLQPRKLFKCALYILLFILIGYGYKVCIWIDLCVLESSGVPCKDEYASLFTMPFPIDLGVLYTWAYPGESQLKYSRSFFSLDEVHALCSFSAATYILCFYGICRLAWLPIRWVLSLFYRRHAEFKRAVIAQRRRNLVRQEK